MKGTVNSLMDCRPIGVFDSGLGGLTAVRELKKRMPEENVVYFGDTGRVPYGTRGRETIEMYAQQAMDFLQSKDVKMIIAACGTVSSVAVNAISRLRIPFTGVVKPAAQAAVKSTKTRCVGVIGTSATVNSGSFMRAVKELDEGVEVFSKACPLFVPLVENGFIEPDNEAANIICRTYLDELTGRNIDTLILGCTHFPLMAPIISSVMGEGVKLIDTGKEAVKAAWNILKSRDMLNCSGKEGRHDYYVSDSVQNFKDMAWIFLGERVTDNIELVRLG